MAIFNFEDMMKEKLAREATQKKLVDAAQLVEVQALEKNEYSPNKQYTIDEAKKKIAPTK